MLILGLLTSGIQADRAPVVCIIRRHCIRQHTSAYVTAYVSIRHCIRQHTSAYVSIRQHTSAHVSTRQNTSAYVSIRQHTPAYVRLRQTGRRIFGLSVSSATKLLRCQYLYFCTSNASKVSTRHRVGGLSHVARKLPPPHVPASVSIRQRMRLSDVVRQTSAYVSGCGFPPLSDRRPECIPTDGIRQHVSAYASIYQHTSTYISICQHVPAYVSIRQHMSAYVSMCQHMSA
jgi:hypothetical protein